MNTTNDCSRTPTVIYLHGLASSPASKKAEAFSTYFGKWDLDVVLPDLNKPRFGSLTVSRAVAQVLELVDSRSVPGPLILMGSSFGGLVCSRVAQRRLEKVDALCLMAPAFDMTGLWVRVLGERGLEAWRRKGELEVDHPAYPEPQRLGYAFYEDALAVGTEPVALEGLPSLVFQGQEDDVVAPACAEEFAALNPWAQLHRVDDGHDLGESVPFMARTLRDFLSRRGLIPTQV